MASKEVRIHWPDPNTELIQWPDGSQEDITDVCPNGLVGMLKREGVTSVIWHNGPIGQEDPGLYGDLKTGTYSVADFIAWLDTL